MAQHYFVVVFDTDTSEWFVDDEVLVARFPDGSVFDGTGWRTLTDSEVDTDWDVSVKLGEGLLALTERIADGV